MGWKTIGVRVCENHSRAARVKEIIEYPVPISRVKGELSALQRIH